MFGMKRLFFGAAAGLLLSFFLAAGEYPDVLAKVETWIVETYRSAPRARRNQEKKLDEIVNSANDEAAKIAALKKRFPEAFGRNFPCTVLLRGNVKLSMVKIKAGTFMMGSPGKETGRYDDEKQHRVTLSKDFWMGKYEVTQGQWQAVMGNNPSHFKGEDRPVENVSWNDARIFCGKLNELYAFELPIGYRFDLPTEAQWEYACRAGTTTALNSGKNLTSETGTCTNLNDIGWYGKNSGDTTHAVGRKRPNAWGLYDMHGNVWEWCRDWYGKSYGGDGTDSTGPASGSERVGRGGSWGDLARDCRSAIRLHDDPGSRGIILGFRLALVPIQ